jgi:hypothetical protein
MNKKHNRVPFLEQLLGETGGSRFAIGRFSIPTLSLEWRDDKSGQPHFELHRIIPTRRDDPTALRMTTV